MRVLAAVTTGGCLSLSGQFASLASATLISDAEQAIRDSVASIESDYAGIIYDGEDMGVCEYFDGCHEPVPVSSKTSQQIPGWTTSDTPYHGFCDGGDVATRYPETPDCPATQHTVCGLDVSFERATIKFLTDTDFSSKDVADAICVQRNLDLLWEEEFDGVLDSANYTEYIYSTVGDTGSLMQFPGVEWGTCPSSYDPRFRPWYAAASVGPKNVIVVLDVSGSMDSNNRLSLAKEAASTVLGTLSPYDYVGFVKFEASATKYSSLMKQASPNEACKIDDWIDDLRAGGVTNYEAAFDAAFDLYEDSVTAGETSACDTTAVLFLTDGEPTAGKEGQALLDHVSSKFGNNNIPVFTYALGSSVDTSITTGIACASSGASYTVSDGGALATAMASYYYYFTSHIVPETVNPMWQLYREYNSGEQSASVCMGAYDKRQYEEDGLSHLFGVVCADVALDHVVAVDGDSDGFEAVRAASETYCPLFSTTLEERDYELIRLMLPGNPHLCTDEFADVGVVTTASWAAVFTAAVTATLSVVLGRQ